MDTGSNEGRSQFKPELSKKLDVHTRHLLSTRTPRSLAALIRVKAALTTAQREEIEAMGVQIMADVGTVLTVRIPIEKLPEFLDLEYVLRVTGCRPLYPE